MSTPAARRTSVQGFRAHRRREALEAAVEAALALLDAMDGDPDLEEEPDREPSEDPEPDLGWRHENWTIGGRLMSQVHGTDADPLCPPETQRSPLAAVSRSGLPDTGGRAEELHASPLSRCGGAQLLDPDETSDPTPPRVEAGLGGAL